MQKTYAFNGVGVKIMGRNELEELSRKGFVEGTFVVSIVNTEAPLVRITKHPTGILRLAFDDVGNDEHLISCQTMDDADAKGSEIIAPISKPITEQQAELIARFVDSNLLSMEYLICQCEMGHSRSAAVAAAIIEHYTGISSGIFDDNCYYPNEFVYSATLKALEKLCE